MFPWLLALLPAAFYLTQLGSYGRLEYDDYYGILPQMAEGARYTASPWRWLAVRSNEHSVVLPALAFSVNASITGGDNRVLSALAVTLLWCASAFLWRSLPTAFSGSRVLRVAGPLLLSGLALSPAGSYSMVMGFSGVIWFMSIAFSVVAIVALRRGVRSESAIPLAAVFVAGWASVLSYGAGLFVWPALLAGALMYRMPRRRFAALCFGAVVPFVFAVSTYVRPAGHPGLSVASPRLLVEFVAVYLGSYFVANPWAAGIVGLAGLGTAALLAGHYVRAVDSETKDELIPWVMLGLYGLLNAAGTAVARSALGGARSSRYAPVAALFWMALLVAGLTVASRGSTPRRRSPAVVGLAMVLSLVVPLAATWWRGLPIFAGWVERAAWQPVAELALVDGVEDWDVLETLSVAPREVLARRELLARLGHLPFGRPASGAMSSLGLREDAGASPCGSPAATVSSIHPVGGGTVRVEGVLERDGPAPPEMAIVDGHGGVRGVVRFVGPLPFPARLAMLGSPPRRWAGYAQRVAPDELLRIVSRASEDRARPCAASGSWRASDRPAGASFVGSWKQPLGLRQSTP